MKKIFLALFLIGILVVAALSVFIFTFDLNRYRPQIEKQASAAVGHPVKIGNLSLAWRGGLAIEIDGVQIFSNDEPVLKVQNAGAVLQITPLLRRSIQIGSIFLDGAEIRVTKNADGKTEIQGLSPTATQSPAEVSDKVASASPVPSTQSSAWTSFLIGSLKLKNIRIHYEDDTPAFPVQLDLKDLELSVKNVSMFRPMEFDAAAALWSSRQNVRVSGRLKVMEQGAHIQVEDFKAETDLGQVDLNEVANSLPALMKQVPVSGIAGKLKADLHELNVRNGKLGEFQADLALTEGQVSAFGASPLVDRLQISVNQFRLHAPVDFKIQGALLSDDSNLSLQGRLEMGDEGRIVIAPAQADLNLDRLNWKRVLSFLDSASSSQSAAFLTAAPEGRFHADIRRLDFDPKRIPAGDIDFRLDQGRLKLKGLPQDLNQINMTGTLRGDQLNMDVWNVNLGTSPAEGRLNIQNLFTAPIFRSEIKARSLNLASLLPPSAADQPQLEGILSFELSVGGSGKVPEVILPSLSGSGHFRVENPVIRNLNILEQIFAKLSAIPGMSSALNQRTSEKLKERLSKRDTNLQTIDQNFFLQNQSIHFENLEVISPDLMIRGPVNVQLDGVVSARPTVLIHEEIMAELTERVHELSYALNSRGQLQIPLTITGKAPQISILPDIQFLLGEIVRNKSTQVVGQIGQRVAQGKGIGNISQILGVTPYESETVPASSSTEPSASTTDDSSVPVKVHSAGGQQRQASLLDALTGSSSQSNSGKLRKAEIATGILNTFLSGNGNESDSNNESDSSANFR